MLTIPFYRLGQVEYDTARNLQLQWVKHIFQDNEPGALLLLEHPPVVTLGKGAGAEHLLVTPDVLREQRISLCPSERGGDITYHGPGQIVGYPLLNLTLWEKDVHRYLRALEEVLIQFLSGVGIVAFRFPPHTGVWVNNKAPEKIAAIGVAVKRWVTYHGFALNIDPELAHFSFIVPCGIRDHGVTSLARLTGGAYSFQDRATMMEALALRFGAVFGFDMKERTDSLLPETLPHEANRDPRTSQTLGHGSCPG